MADDAAWRQAKVEARPVLGRVVTAMTPKPTAQPEAQSTTAWKIGAEGEERVAEVLRDLAGIVVLHDLRVPGKRSNIDHVVVGPAGVFVIDAKKWKRGSAVEVRDKGSFLRPDLRLYVGGRDRTKAVEGVRDQVGVVRQALGPDLEGVSVQGLLCFVGASWGWRMRTRTVAGVTAVWPLGLPKLVTAAGSLGPHVEQIADRLRSGLPPAVR